MFSTEVTTAPPPGEARLRLCKMHSMQWTNRRQAVDDWSAFLARPRAHHDLGDYVAASCYPPGLL